jgi:UDP-glucose:(heptosyl)LPS alpha-1,3-glucosyltransferase
VRVALVIFRAEVSRGGAERYTADLAAALVARGHEPTVVTSFPDDAMDGVRQVCIHRRAITKYGQYEEFLRGVESLCQRERYDVVHAMLPVTRCDIYHPHAGLAAEAMAGGSALQRLFNLLNLRRRRYASVERDLLTGGDPPVMLCLSDYVKRAALRHYAIDQRRLATLHNGVDIGRFDPALRLEARQEVRQRLGIAHDAVVALTIAQDFARKGLRQAIQATARLDAPLVLLVVGKPEARAYRRLARRLGAAGRVIFAGGTSDPHAFYQAADFFVLPTRHDPCALVTLESLSMGVPVVTTAQNGAGEVITQGREGFVLADPYDVAGLAAAMGRLLDPELRGAMRRACLDLRPRLSQDHHVQRLLELYEQVSRAKAARAAST